MKLPSPGSALAVDDVVSVPECPCGERNKQRAQLVATAGQAVAHSRRDGRQGVTVDQPVALHPH